MYLITEGVCIHAYRLHVSCTKTFSLAGGRGHQRSDHTHSDYEGRIGGMRGVRVRGGRGGRGGGHRQVCNHIPYMGCGLRYRGTCATQLL